MIPEALLSQKDLELVERVREFVAGVPKELLAQMDNDEVRYPKDYLLEAGKRGLLGLRFPQAYGGGGLGWREELLALEEVGVLGTSLACLYSLVSIVGEAIVNFGTEAQKERYLVPMLKGQMGTAEALTEPRGGSDFFGATTRAVRKGDAFYLTGQKRFVVGSEGADVFLLYATLDGIDDPKRAMTVFLVERAEGLEVRHLYGLMGTRGGGTGRIVLKDVRVPIENVLGGVEGLGRGAEVFNRMMIPERLTSAGGSVGMGRAALEVAAAYADKRKAFGEKIRRFQAVSFKVAKSVTLLDCARALNFTAGELADKIGPTGQTRRFVSEAKRFATDAAWKVVNDAMQVMGGIGYTNVYPIERLLRDIRLITIWTGTNEIMDLLIQHEYFRELLSSPKKTRNVEEDAQGAEYEEEKVYE